eukprot:12474674-Alexandrium_andersonii.AAC.1
MRTSALSASFSTPSGRSMRAPRKSSKPTDIKCGTRSCRTVVSTMPQMGGPTCGCRQMGMSTTPTARA